MAHDSTHRILTGMKPVLRTAKVRSSGNAWLTWAETSVTVMPLHITTVTHPPDPLGLLIHTVAIETSSDMSVCAQDLFCTSKL